MYQFSSDASSGHHVCTGQQLHSTVAQSRHQNIPTVYTVHSQISSLFIWSFISFVIEHHQNHHFNVFFL